MLHTVLENVKSIKYLGVTITNNLRLNTRHSVYPEVKTGMVNYLLKVQFNMKGALLCMSCKTEVTFVMAFFCTKNDTDACFTLLFSFLQPFPFLPPFLQTLSSLFLPVLFSFRSPLISPIPLSHLSSLSPIYLLLLSVLKKSVIFQWYLHTTRTHPWTRPENNVFKSNQETLYILKVNWTRHSDNFKNQVDFIKMVKTFVSKLN